MIFIQYLLIFLLFVLIFLLWLYCISKQLLVGFMTKTKMHFSDAIIDVWYVIDVRLTVIWWTPSFSCKKAEITIWARMRMKSPESFTDSRFVNDANEGHIEDELWGFGLRRWIILEKLFRGCKYRWNKDECSLINALHRMRKNNFTKISDFH